jgi:membrane-associated HD superfamily phosphohydrolase
MENNDNQLLTKAFDKKEGPIKVLFGSIFFITGILVTVFSYLYGLKTEVIIRNGVTGFICGGILVYMLSDASGRGLFAYDNGQKRDRFVIVYYVMLILSLFLPMIAIEAWPYVFVFLLLGLFSTNEIGLFSGSFLLMFSVLLEKEGSYAEFFIYFVAGAVVLALLRDLNETTKIGFPIFISMTVLFILIVGYDIMMKNRTLSYTMLIVPFVNIFICLILMMITLNIFAIYVIRKSNDRYMDINDTEYPLLVQLKEKDKDAYFRAIHIAYLAERIALELNLNARAVKTMSYYYRIGVLDGSSKWEDVKHFYIENNFPEEAIGFLEEYIVNDRSKQLSKEAAVIYMSETVIASITYLFNKDKDAKINYDDLIDKIFAHKMENRELYCFNISLYELEHMKALLKKEKLYFDFLR